MIEWLVGSADPRVYYTSYYKEQMVNFAGEALSRCSFVFLFCGRFCFGKRIRRGQFSLLKPRESAVFFRSSEAP
jgi:hypothetical protein